MTTESAVLSSAQIAEEVATLEGRIPGLEKDVKEAQGRKAAAALRAARGDDTELLAARQAEAEARDGVEVAKLALKAARGELAEAQRRDRLEEFDAAGGAALAAYDALVKRAGSAQKAADKALAELEAFEAADAELASALLKCSLEGRDMNQVLSRRFVPHWCALIFGRFLGPLLERRPDHNLRNKSLVALFDGRRGGLELALARARERVAGGAS